MSAQRGVSARTHAEMARGAKQVLAASAWATADRIECEWRAKYYHFAGAINIVASPSPETCAGITMIGAETFDLTVTVHPRDGKAITFPSEPYGVFPTPKLHAQLALLLG